MVATTSRQTGLSAVSHPHDRMVDYVEQMLGLHKNLAAARTDHDKTFLKRQIDATDRQIDQLVYELYRLTEEEIAIVEGATDAEAIMQASTPRK